MLNPCRIVKVALVLGLVMIGVSGVARAESGVCENTKGAARGLCDAYCVHMQCNTPGKNASDAACRSVASQFESIAGVPLVCAISPLTCTCAAGILNCSATGLAPGTTAFLNIDLTAYSYGFNGVGDAPVDASGNVQFPPFDLFTYLADRTLVLSSVIMAVTNQPGQILLETIVPTCPR